jgi:hypothetical protein
MYAKCHKVQLLQLLCCLLQSKPASRYSWMKFNGQNLCWWDLAKLQAIRQSGGQEGLKGYLQ